MGNSSSAAVQLRTPSGLPRDTRNRKHNKYACAENRVLPAPVAGQRLRSTDNGNILQNGGTISGRKLALLQQQRNNSSTSESDFTSAMNRSLPDESGRDTLYGHRKSHSDPDIVRSMHRNSLADEDSSEGGCGGGGSSSGSGHQLRSIIAESPSKAKIRWRKKGRAPDPPTLSSTLPRDLDRLPLYEENAGKARPRSKSPAPIPPPALPPPGPDPPTGGYEKNKRWRPQESNFLTRSELMRKSFGDVEAGNHNKSSLSETQNKSFNAKVNAKALNKPLNRSFQEEILAAAKRKSQNLKLHVLSLARDDVVYKSSPLKGSEALNRNIPAWDKNVATKEVVTKLQPNSKIPSTSGVRRNDNFEMRRKPDKKYEDDMSPKSRSDPQLETGRSRIIDEEPHSEPKKYFFSNMVKQTRQETDRSKSTEIYRQQQQRQNNLNHPHEMRQKSEDEEEWSLQQQVRNANSSRDDVVLREKTNEKSSREMTRHQGRAGSRETPRQLTRESREMTKESSRELTRESCRDLNRGASREVTRESSRKLTKESCRDLNRDSSREVTRESSSELVRDSSRDIPKEFSQEMTTRESSREAIREKWLNENRSLRGSSRSSRYSSCSSSSEKEDDDDDDKAIGVQLRPVLPRKNVTMPQFSPTQAWKNISVDSPSFYSSDASGSSSEDVDAVEEEVIMNVHRPVAPRRSFPERCAGDSGISPDAGSPLPVHEVMPRRRPGVGRAATPPEDEMHWTPQQDLLDDSDLGSVQDVQGRRWTEPPILSLHAKLTLPNGMFGNKQLESALPPVKADEKNGKNRNRRRNKKQEPSEENQHFNSLRSLKKVLRLRSKSMDEANRGLDSNWSLSRSTPTIAATESAPKVYQELRRSPSESALHREVEEDLRESERSKPENGHLLYLPEYDSAPQMEQDRTPSLNVKKKVNKKMSKFSYQNTFRREAKKKLAEKVSREVAEKEKRREDEIKWMNKVEEEFRKRRDREKINIRYQLKMLSDEETGFDSSGDWQNQSPTQESRSLPFVPSSKMDQSAEKVTQKYTTSSTSTSSPDLHPIWNSKQPTGMSKWLKKQPSNSQRPAYTRPEPEGGRSSGDEFKPHENGKCITENQKIRNGVPLNKQRVSSDDLAYTETSEFTKQNGFKYDEHNRSAESLNISTNMKLKTSDAKLAAEQSYKSKGEQVVSESKKISRLYQKPSYPVADNQDYSNRNHESEAPSGKKLNIYKHLSSLIEREEQHLRHQDTENRMDPSENVPNHLPFSTEGFQTELMARVQGKSPASSAADSFHRGHPHRSGGRMSRPLTSSNQGTQQATSKGPVLQLAPVTPFNPSKTYRPVPFELVVSPTNHRSNKSSSPLRADTRPVRTAVQAR